MKPSSRAQNGVAHGVQTPPKASEESSNLAPAQPADPGDGHSILAETNDAGSVHLRCILDSIFGFVGLFSTEGTILEVNRAPLEVAGLERFDVVGRPFWETYWWSHSTELQNRVRDAISGAAKGETVRQDMEVRIAGGGIVVVDATFGPIQNAAGEIHQVIAFGVDITERKRAETLLQESEERLRLMLESVRDYAIFLLDPTGRVASWNTGAERIKGYSAAEIQGQHFSIFYTPEDKTNKLPEKVLAEASAEGPCEHEGWRVRKDGSRFWANIVVSSVRDAAGQLRGFVKVTRDMTEWRKADAALRQGRDRLTQLSRQLIEAQEMERRRIARELHDQFGQSLALLQIQLQTAHDTPETEKMASVLDEGVAMVERLHEQVRNLSLDLRPSVLDDLGLAPALRWYSVRLAQSSGMEIQFSSVGLTGRYPSEVETTCFRVAQEALTNVLRHAQAKKAEISLLQSAAKLILRISDDGVGFDVDASRQQASRGFSVGLLSMEERMRLAGGELVIESRPPQGTTITAAFPLAALGTPATKPPST